MEFIDLLKKFQGCVERDMTVEEIEKELNFKGGNSQHNLVNKLAYLLQVEVYGK